MTRVSRYGEVFELRTARAGVLVSRPSGHAERQVTHPSTLGPVGCKQAVREGARNSLSLVCRGGHPAEHPGCVVWVAAGTHKRARPSVVLFSSGGVRRASARESHCQTPGVGRHRVAAGSTHAPHESVQVRLTCSTGTPHRLRTRMCNRTSHSRGFSKSPAQSFTGQYYFVHGRVAYVTVATSARAPTYGRSRSWRRCSSTSWTLGFVLGYGGFSADSCGGRRPGDHVAVPAVHLVPQIQFIDRVLAHSCATEADTHSVNCAEDRRDSTGAVRRRNVLTPRMPSMDLVCAAEESGDNGLIQVG